MNTTLPGHGLAMILAAVCLLTAPACAQNSNAFETFRGVAHLSAIAPAGTGTFFAARDEDNIIRLYPLDTPGDAIAEFEWSGPLAVAGSRFPEVDIEGAARHEDRIYWIGSHGRNREGKWRENRHRLFATQIVPGTNGPVLKALGQPLTDLAGVFAQHPSLIELGVATALGPIGKRQPDLAPTRHGFNIEGMAISPDGGTLWIGLRNPVPRAQAVLIPLTNPDATIQGQERPTLGDPVLLDLDGLGIRDIVYAPTLQQYLILAGMPGPGRRFALYTWDGSPPSPPRLIVPPSTFSPYPAFTPEALLLDAATDTVVVCSDDGDLAAPTPSQGEKDDRRPYREPAGNAFRAIRLPLPATRAP